MNNIEQRYAQGKLLGAYTKGLRKPRATEFTKLERRTRFQLKRALREAVRNGQYHTAMQVRQIMAIGGDRG